MYSEFMVPLKFDFDLDGFQLPAEFLDSFSCAALSVAAFVHMVFKLDVELASATDDYVAQAGLPEPDVVEEATPRAGNLDLGTIDAEFVGHARNCIDTRQWRYEQPTPLGRLVIPPSLC